MNKLNLKRLMLMGLALCPMAHADISLPKLLSDGLVLQREMPSTLWGWASDGEPVTMYLNKKKVAATTARNGEWSLSIDGLTAGGPHTLTLKGNNSITLKDIYFGDVWVASGQSNMQTPMYRVEEMFADEIAAADYPLLRQFTVPRVMTFDGPAKDYEGGQWEKSTPELIRNHSATAFFFGRKIMQEENVPVGILSANFGGSPAECWMSEEALKPYKPQYERGKSLQDTAYLQSLQDADQADIDAWFHQLNSTDLGLQNSYEKAIDDSGWQQLSIPGLWQDQGLDAMAGIVWLRRTIELPAEAEAKPGFLRLGTIVDADTAYINGVEVGKTYYQYPPRRYPVKEGILKAGKNTITLRVQVENKRGEFVVEKPYYLKVGDHQVDLTGNWKYKIGTVMADAPKPRRFVPWNEPLGCYNAMLAPLFNMGIKGVIWYQGESNTGNAQEYEQLFPHLIRHWREQWNQGDFPFLFVQLANYMKAHPQPTESQWAETRFAQFKALKEPNTAMTVAIDVGEWNDLHPLDKKSVGERLALSAQALAYGKANLVYSGPLLKNISAKKNKLIVHFDHIGKGLVAKGKKLGGFAIAGEDGKYIWAHAKIKNNTVVVWHKDIKKPVHVRYAWADTPENANLYNKEGLPASPFEAGI